MDRAVSTAPKGDAGRKKRIRMRRMFTGLIEGTGTVTSVRHVGNDMRVTIAPSFAVVECRSGDSIAVDGVCLTITDLSGDAFSMDVSGETLSRSTLGELKQGSEVNLERALRLSDRLGGHLVLGHVDGVGRILGKQQQQRSWVFRIGMDPSLSRYTIQKGSIAVDGISLTVNRCGKDFFEVNIIPQTGRETTLLKKNVGDRVNLETDLIGKYIEKLIRGDNPERVTEKSSGIDMEMLITHGFGV